MTNLRSNRYAHIKKEDGYNSGFEKRVASELSAAGVSFTYEEDVIKYTVPARVSRYTPDFKIGNMYIETKGHFTSSDRKKHKLVKEQFPNLDIRIVFNNSNTKIGKKSKTTYAMWCHKMGIQYADKTIPPEWLEGSKSNGTVT